MIRNKTQKLTVSGFLLALGIVLPYALAHGLGVAGTILLPMHIPVLLCGFFCGPVYGATCGIALPLLNCLLTGMPSPFPMLPIMLAELTIYGLVSGLLFSSTPLERKKFGIYAALPITMICGRIAYTAVFYILLFTVGEIKALAVTSAIVTGLPGIIVQFLIIPPIIFMAGRTMLKQNENAIQSAKNLIMKDKASCVVIKDNKILNIEHASGISPIIALYESGALKDAVIVDKIVGKAAASVMSLGGVKACYGITVSTSAVEYLKSRGIAIDYDSCVDYIVNRRGDGQCPMEDAVKSIDNEQEALAAIKERLIELRQKNN
ncbi:MAG: DUF1893 domain-containing protein [Ruminococcaceae bacterium]|nr:DUF1893 domain-containing protein [Oscillospiraceae bacterium]